MNDIQCEPIPTFYQSANFLKQFWNFCGVFWNNLAIVEFVIFGSISNEMIICVSTNAFYSTNFYFRQIILFFILI